MHIHIDFSVVRYYLLTFVFLAAALFYIVRHIILRIRCRDAVSAEMQQNRVYRYDYNGRTYTAPNPRYGADLPPAVGSIRQIFVNPKNPEQFLDVPYERKCTLKCVVFLLICGAVVFLIGSGIRYGFFTVGIDD